MKSNTRVKLAGKPASESGKFPFHSLVFTPSFNLEVSPLFPYRSKRARALQSLSAITAALQYEDSVDGGDASKLSEASFKGFFFIFNSQSVLLKSVILFFFVIYVF